MTFASRAREKMEAFDQSIRRTCLGWSMPKNQRGVALPTSLLALLMISLLGLALTASGIVSVTLSTNDLQAGEALYLAESGITHAKSILFSQGQGFDTYLQTGNGTACDGDELSDPPSSPLSAGDEITSAASGGESFGAGRYEVSVCDDHDFESTASGPGLPDTDPDHDANNLVRIVSTGYGADGSTVTLEATIKSASSGPAVIVESNLTLDSDNPTEYFHVTGSEGAVHTNGDLDLDGDDACVEQYFSAVGSIIHDSHANTGAHCDDSPTDKRAGAAPFTLPDLDPVDFKNDADWILKADGTITDQDGNPQTGLPWDNWVYNSTQREWNYHVNDALTAGTYYSEGNIDMDGSPGHGGPPITLTLIAEGHIQIDGGPWMESSLTKNGTAYAMIAGHDIDIDGNMHSTGQIYARHQLDIGSDALVDIDGQIIGFNAADTDYPNPGDKNAQPLLTGGYMSISAEPGATIRWDGGGGSGNITLVGWRECRGANAADPCQ